MNFRAVQKVLPGPLINRRHRGKEAVEEHRKVFEVALARDIDTAAEMLKTHIDKGLEHTLAAF